ncbi:uncharacterized protein [Lolium perenne]|uniref:uncharacterized protein n=1 Tax=Lolium perenne TaxID=4522 RepID=UPI0021F62BF6|nr:uncharacterized protein LOC127343867 [Lolium perenne]
MDPVMVGSILISPPPVPPWPGDQGAFPSLCGARGPDLNPATPLVREDTAMAHTSPGLLTLGMISTAPGRASACSDLEAVEEFFGQLWVVPGTPPPSPTSSRHCLVWIRKDLAGSGRFTISDCFPALPAERFLPVSRQVRVGRRQDRASYAEILARGSMASGGLGRGRGRGPLQAPPPPAPRLNPPAPTMRPVAPNPAPTTNLVGAGAPRAQSGQFQRQGSQGQVQQQHNRNYGYQQNNQRRFQHNRPAQNGNNRQNPAGLVSAHVEPILPVPAPAQPAVPTPVPEQELDPRYSKLICFNCGDPGHFVGNCVKPKICFICNIPGHIVYNCPEWLKEHPVADYFGSANSGLGFYHIDVPDQAETQWLNFRNCGIVQVKKGEINLTELEKSLSGIFCKNKSWPWQMRELDSANFLVRFPPWKKVEELIEFPAFALKEDSVTVKIVSWDREVPSISELVNIWVTVKGIPPKWCAWKTFAQVASVIGILMDVDWPVLFKSFYESVRIQVAVRDVSKVPSGRIVEMEQKLYMLTFLFESASGSSSGDDNPPGPSNVVVQPEPTSLMDTDNNSIPTEPAPTSHPAPASAPGGSRSCVEAPLVINLDGVRILDHVSWNGDDLADRDFADDLVLVDSPCSIPAKWDYSRLEDSVWDFDPSVLNMDELVEADSTTLLEHSSVNLTYCSDMIKEIDDDGSEADSEDKFLDAEDNMTLAPEICNQIFSAKRNLLPSLDLVNTPVVPHIPTLPVKSKWGPVVAPRMGTRNHGAVNIMEKAKEYQKRKNLEVPTRGKGKKLARSGHGLEQGDCMSWQMEGSLRGCTFGGGGPVDLEDGAKKRRPAKDYLGATLSDFRI